MTQVASFDVFDTMLTRAVGSPRTVFLLMGRRAAHEGLLQCTPEVFARVRVEAEQRARRNAEGREVTIDHIYAELADSLGLTKPQEAQLVEFEKAVEDDLIRAVPGARERIDAVRASGKRVVFVSDMYLPGTFIRRALEKNALIQSGDHCYISCEEGHGKVNGLFQRVLERERIPPHEMVHIGNSQTDDIGAATRHGIDARSFAEGNLTRLESVLEEHAYETEGLSSAMAGAARLARLANRHVRSEREQSIRGVAASLVGPTLTGYVLWVLRRAAALKLKRLYFVSRDGQILLEIARRLSERLHLDCELRYLYGSRQAWHLPAISTIGERELGWLFSRGAFLSIETLLRRVDVGPEEIAQELNAAGFPKATWLKNLTQRETEQFCASVIKQNASVRGLIIERAKKRREILVKYLEQEQLLSPDPVGLVDLGWWGRLQESLAIATGIKPVGFYFGLQKGSLDACYGDRQCYLFDQRGTRGYGTTIPGIFALIETFCQADHGLVLGYRERVDRMIPVLQHGGNDAVIRWGLPLVHKTVHDFVEALLLDTRYVNVWADARPAITRALKTFWVSPRRSEMSGWAQFPFEGDQTGSCSRALAIPYGWRQVPQAFVTGRMASRFLGEWRDGCWVITPRWMRMGIKVALRVHDATDGLIFTVVKMLRLGDLRRAIQGRYRILFKAGKVPGTFR